MQLTNEDSEEFRAVYKKDTGEDLTIDEARGMASNLLQLYFLLARPLPSEIEAQAKRLSDGEDHLPPEPQQLSLLP